MLISDELNLKYPIFCGAMARITDAKFASEISNAGALGILAAGDMTPSSLRDEVKLLKTLTNNPFAVNVMLQSPYCDEIVDMLIEEDVKIVIFGAGLPLKYMDKLNAANIKVFAIVSNTAFAKKLKKYNPFGYIVEGCESGGHIGRESSLPLLQAMKKEFPNDRLIAAGGFATGKSLNAAIALGYCGIQMGTRFLASIEAPIDIKYKEEILKASDNKTMVTGEKFGLPVRVIKNKFAKNYRDVEDSANDRLELEILAVGSLKKAISGDIENGSMMCGEIASVIDDIKSIKDILECIIAEAKEDASYIFNTINELKK